MRDAFYVDWLNSDSRAMTDAALDDAEAREKHETRQLARTLLEWLGIQWEPEERDVA